MVLKEKTEEEEDVMMADLEHERYHSGLPTPIFAGFNFQDGEAIKLGSTEGISSNMPEAKAYYLEFSGKGLEALEKAAEQKESWMIQLGASLLDSYQLCNAKPHRP